MVEIKNPWTTPILIVIVLSILFAGILVAASRSFEPADFATADIAVAATATAISVQTDRTIAEIRTAQEFDRISIETAERTNAIVRNVTEIVLYTSAAFFTVVAISFAVAISSRAIEYSVDNVIRIRNRFRPPPPFPTVSIYRSLPGNENENEPVPPILSSHIDPPTMNRPFFPIDNGADLPNYEQ